MNTNQRHTPAKEAIAKFIETAQIPFSAQQVIDHLNNCGLRVNKTTVYRQLDSYLEQELLQTVNLNDGVTRYELKQDHCHHHVVCTNCGNVAHVELGDELSKLQNKLSHETGFQIREHMLEFFGTCKECTDDKLLR